MTQNEQLIIDTIEQANAVFGFDIRDRCRAPKYVCGRAIVSVYLFKKGIPHKVICKYINVDRTVIYHYLQQYASVDKTHFEYHELFDKFKQSINCT